MDSVSPRARAERRRARSRTARTCTILLRRITRRADRDRDRCRSRFGRTPGRVSVISARATGPSTITLSFQAAGTDRSNPPAARGYLIKQSLRPIVTRRDFSDARALCHGRCGFKVDEVGTPITLTVTNLNRRRSYYYAVAARDNVSARPGPHSKTVNARIG